MVKLFHKRLLWSLFVLLTIAGDVARADLFAYVQSPDPTFSWKLVSKTVLHGGTVYDLQLVSQVWQGITWEHQLQVYLPKDIKPTGTMFLWNQGGKANPTTVALGMDLANKMNAPVAFLYDIPNQPLLGGKKEDGLIAETFVRYLQTKDETWPLLFPMVKSLVRAMDALQAFAKQEWQVEVSRFVISGGSKRGWTTWLTAAADARVKALAPCVIDTLNMQAQLPHQLKSYGKYSDMIADYTKRGLVPLPDTPESKKLWGMMDPWTYRAKLAKPTMIINGTNDPYWTQDALNLYWNDLPGEKWICYVPNAGHNLIEKRSMPSILPDMTRAMCTLSAFARCQIHNEALPNLKWHHGGAGPTMRLAIETDQTPKAARLWFAQAPTRDFRKAQWLSRPLDRTGTNISGAVESPPDGFVVFFGELEYEKGGLTYYLSTQLRVAEAEQK